MMEMMEMGWDRIPIHPILSFFGFFTLTSIAAAWRGYYGQIIYQVIIGLNISLSLIFLAIITAHNVLEITQMTSITDEIYNLTFALFSIAWAFALLPIILFWIIVRKM